MANLQPARTKWRKHRKGKIRGNATACNTLSFGDFGIQSLDRGRVPANQIEAARIAISRALKRKGKMWMRIFPHTPVTKKPAEVRMGSGKGLSLIHI
jgi:large subunit ribosomal protein L16